MAERADAATADAAMEPVDVWLVPVADFPESEVATLLRRLRADLPWLRIYEAARIPRPDAIDSADGTQVVGQKAVEAFAPVARALPKTKSNTACVFLIADDLNIAGGRLRFTFSVNDRNSHVAVVSRARMVLGEGAVPASAEQVDARLYKMVKRQVGELRLGLVRTSERDNLMYSPLMGVPDLDRIGTEF